MQILRTNIIFVLVRPSFPGNIGSVARVMKNFGFTSLRLVAPPKEYRYAAARQMAVGAFDILKNCTVHADLHACLTDVGFAVGSAAQQYRKIGCKPLHKMRNRIVERSQKNIVALVFGSERNGLRADELAACHAIVTIPTDPACPSLNLAQAAGIVAYEINRSLEAEDRCRLDAGSSKTYRYPTVARGEEFLSSLSEIMELVGFTRSFNRRKVSGELRSLYLRSNPTKREIDLMEGILHQIKKRITLQH